MKRIAGEALTTNTVRKYTGFSSHRIMTIQVSQKLHITVKVAYINRRLNYAEL
jgi:hypothetical protein